MTDAGENPFSTQLVVPSQELEIKIEPTEDIAKAIGPVVLPKGEVLIANSKDIIISQNGVIMIMPGPDSLPNIVYEDHQFGVSVPVREITSLLKLLDDYLKVKRISQETFASMVLGLSSSAFSNLKRAVKTAKTTHSEMDAKNFVTWARVQYYLENLATFHPNTPVKAPVKAPTSARGVKKTTAKKVRSRSMFGSSMADGLSGLELVIPQVVPDSPLDGNIKEEEVNKGFFNDFIILEAKQGVNLTTGAEVEVEAEVKSEPAY